MLTAEELLDKIKRNEHIKPQDIGVPSWRSECAPFYYELGWCGRIAYNHKDGFRWADGTFLTRRECKRYHIQPGINNL